LVNASLSSYLSQFPESEWDMSYAKGALATYFMFNMVFSFTYTPLQGVIPTEALETTTRAKGLAAYNFIVQAFGFINQFCGPIALGNIQQNYVWVFVAWDSIETVCWYFFGYVDSTQQLGTPYLHYPPPVSNHKAEPSSSSNGSTTSPSQSRPLSRWTRSWCRATAGSPKRLWRMSEQRSYKCTGVLVAAADRVGTSG
jgi:hypothetical protein